MLVGVAPDYQGQGLMKSLFYHTTDWAEKMGVDSIVSVSEEFPGTHVMRPERFTQALHTWVRIVRFWNGLTNLSRVRCFTSRGGSTRVPTVHALNKKDLGSFDVTSSATPHFLIPPSEMAKLSEMLKETFRGEISTMVTGIVTGVLRGLEDRISSLEKTNSDLKKENKSLTARVNALESQADQAEQYSRRNCLRVSGYTEDPNENSDDIVLQLASDIGSPIKLEDIDRSHRVGNPNSTRRKVPRDIIVKFATYRTRAYFYKARTNLKTSGHEGVFVNEDLTKKRNGYLFEARKLVKRKLLKGSWSSDGTILVKDNEDYVHRVSSVNDLIPFGYIPPPTKRPGVPPPVASTSTAAPLVPDGPSAMQSD